MIEKILWMLCLLIVLFTEFAWSQNINEISVIADAEILSPNQISRFTLTFETTGDKAVDIEKKLNTQVEDLKSNLKNVSILSSRVELEPEIKIGRAYIDCETTDSSSLANALDTAKSSGALLIGKINYSFSNEQDDAIKRATLMAKRKAEKIALNLGVKVGNPISVLLADEPLGTTLLQARQLGGPVDPATIPQRTKISIQARFAIAN